MPTAETQAKASIQHGLKQLGYRVIRMQSGVVRKGKRFIHMAAPGTADLLCFSPTGVHRWIEVKAALGKQSTEQVEFARWCHETGQLYHLCRSLDEVLEALDR